ncbi:MAG: winged helix-turn-helix domain-containing protein [Methylobacter sp.]|nr:winged helix-turn-helix domain-containing protein [Methylobacter sp.]MDP2100023.1 winged helix-turn-helix domain-containing protein [Methylobacter sp.]MDP2427836.1 winged helix-turn-helix domain-containing protein [Methylobacter sp.]MDP3055290.1 winged helix-turn-helix domain-containing protein [Methylobacter sp.]MDP3362438.1 winged helix-turn-helix domain-containing protein [Methylobacter sp.]
MKKTTDKTSSSTTKTATSAKATKQPEVVKKAVKEKSGTTLVTKEQPVVAVAAEVSLETSTAKTNVKPKPVKKAPVVSTEPVVSVPAITMHERIGLTAGAVWHYLSEQGTTSIVKLVNAIPEQEDVIQRSIGWLAAEGKITFAVVDYLEAILLKD